MSALFFAHVKHLQHTLNELQAAHAKLVERVAALEKPADEGAELEPDAIAPKRRGRPPKGAE